MDYNDIISYIEDESIELTNDFYYHAFVYDQEQFVGMINEGIKSPVLLGKRALGNNGYFYVSLSKNEKCENSIYNRLNQLPMFIINSKISTIKTRNFIRYGSYPMWTVNSPLPFRQSEYDNEYQKFLMVLPKDILAIQYNIYQCNGVDNKFLILKLMIEDLNSQKKVLPIIDSFTSRKINQKKVLSLKI